MQCIEDLLRFVADPKDKRVPEVVSAYVTVLGAQL
jgi:hypothetical protein